MLFEKIRFCYKETDKVSKFIFKAGFSLFLLLVSASLFTYTFGDLFCADRTTAMLDAAELFFSARECLAAAVIPTMVYEIIRRAAVMK